MQSVTDIQVRFCETDAIGHVNNISYFIYLEQARVDFLKMLGTDISNSDRTIAVVSLHCDYIDQAYFDQTLQVLTSVSRVGNKSFTLSHDVRDKNSQQPIAKGESVVVLLNVEEKRALPLDDDWVMLLESYLVK